MFGMAEIPGALVVCLVPGQATRILHRPTQLNRGARSAGSGFEPRGLCVMWVQCTKDGDPENRHPTLQWGSPGEPMEGAPQLSSSKGFTGGRSA